MLRALPALRIFNKKGRGAPSTSSSLVPSVNLAGP
jgi:hypothetical protein